MISGPRFEFHIAREARDRYAFADRIFSLTGNVVIVDVAASRALAHRMNTVRDASQHPDRTVHPGALNAMGILDEVTHVVLALYRAQRDPRAMLDALDWLEARVTRDALDATLAAFADRFPTVAVYRGLQSAAEWLAGETDGIPHRAVALEELITVWLSNLNPAFRPFDELFDERALAERTAYRAVSGALREYFESRPRFGPTNQNLIDMLRAPALASPDSLDASSSTSGTTGATCWANSCAGCCSRWTCSRKSRWRSGCGFIRGPVRARRARAVAAHPSV